MIQDFLSGLSNDFVVFYKNAQKSVLVQAEARRTRASTELQAGIVGIAHQEEVVVDGQTHTNVEYEYKPIAERSYDEAIAEVAKIEAFNRNLDAKLVELRNIIRIYLKIEWKKAKQGK